MTYSTSYKSNTLASFKLKTCLGNIEKQTSNYETPNLLLYIISLLRERLQAYTKQTNASMKPFGGKTDITNNNMLFVPLHTTYFRIKIHSS